MPRVALCCEHAAMRRIHMLRTLTLEEASAFPIPTEFVLRTDFSVVRCAENDEESTLEERRLTGPITLHCPTCRINHYPYIKACQIVAHSADHALLCQAPSRPVRPKNSSTWRSLRVSTIKIGIKNDYSADVNAYLHVRET